MFYKKYNNSKSKNQSIIISYNNVVDRKIKKYSWFFYFIKYNVENILNYDFYFDVKITNNLVNKKKIYSTINKKNPINYNKSKFLYENQLVGITTTEEMSSSDIVSGLPKLNSLMENSFEPENTQYLQTIFSENYNSQKNFKISDYNLHLSIEKRDIINKKINKRENKDPELYLWFLFSKYKMKSSLNKTLKYSISKTKHTILNSLIRVYKEQNIKLNNKIFANVVNTMFNKVLIAESLSNPFMTYDKIYLKLYLKLLKLGKSLNFIPPIGLIFVEGISKSVTNSQRLLNSISFRDTTNNLISYSLYQPKDWLTSIKSKLILGQKIDVGTSVFIKNKFLDNINNLMINDNH